MNLFLADALNISINLLIVVLVLVSLLLLAVVLIQRPKQEGLGATFGAAITDQAFGARTTDVLKKATVYFGTAFMVICLALAALFNRQHVREAEGVLTSEEAAVVATPEKSPEQIKEEELLKRAQDAAAVEQKTAPATEEQPVAPAPTPGQE